MKNPDGTREGDVRVYELKEYDALREGAPIAPVGILVDGKLQPI